MSDVDFVSTNEAWLILGASSAISRAFAREAAKSGYRILLAGRDTEDLQIIASDIVIRTGASVEVLAFDATGYKSHAKFVADITAKVPGTLNLFLAFGTMPEQLAMERDFELFRKMAETNYLGAVSVLDQFALVLEDRRRGRVVILGSPSGERGRQKNYAYGSTKAALHVYAAGLRARLFRVGVSVTTILPGFVDTAMTWGMPGLLFLAAPEDLARDVWKATQKRKDIVHLPKIWALIMLIIRLIPERIMKRLDI